MKKYVFSNANRCQMQLSEPAWQTKVLAEINDDKCYQEDAAQAQDEFLQTFEADLAAGYIPGKAMEHASDTTHRFGYIKDIKTAFGETFDAEIDLLLLRVSFIKTN